MNRYHIVPSDGIDYTVYASYMEVTGEWSIFRDESDWIIHVCSAKFIKFISMVKE